jgi:hypothetical protein
VFPADHLILHEQEKEERSQSMTHTSQNQAILPRFASGGGVLHVRFGASCFDISQPGLDIGPASDDRKVKRAVAEFLDVPSYRLDDYVIDRHTNGNLTIRPEDEVSAN